MYTQADTEVVQHVLRNKTDYYSVLMISRTATDAQIKSAYKKMALKCHPDKNKHPHSAEAFKLVGTAHSTLSDATKRRVYDRLGADGVRRHENNAGRRPTSGMTSARARAANPHARTFFEEFFNGGGFFEHGGMGGAQYARADPGMNVPPMNFYGVDINPNILLLAPLFIFLLIALLLQSSMTDVSSYPSYSDRSAAGGGGLYRGSAQNNIRNSFSLTPSPEEGFVLQRTSSLNGLHVRFYTTRRMGELMDRRRDVLVSVEKEVLKAQKTYLGNRCEAETFKHRTRGRSDAPKVCADYQRFRAALG